MNALRRLVGPALILAAVITRFARLDGQGLLFFDEGQLILEAREFGALARAWVSRADPAAPRLAALVPDCRITFGKPVHNAALAALLPWFGRADQATLTLSAVAGSATVGAVWVLARAWYGAGVGAAAAALLTASPYHLMYSREGLSDALTVLLVTASLAAFARPGWRRSVTAGGLAGAAFGSNYRELFLPAVFAVLAWLDRRAQPLGRRLAAWTAGFAAVPLVLEGVYRAWEAGANGARFPIGTYAGQLRQLFAYHGGQGFGLGGWLAFPAHVLRWDGPAALAVLLATFACQLTRWRGPDARLNVALLAPWLLFSAYWDNAPRFFAVLLPLAAVVEARWLLALGDRIRRRARSVPGWIPAAAAVVLLAPRAARLVPRPTPYLEAARFLARSGEPRHLSTNVRLGQAYFGPGVAAAVPPDPAEAERLGRQGWRWALTDVQAFFGGFDQPEARLATAERIAERHPTVLTIGYRPDALAQYVLEQDLTFADASALLGQLEALRPRLHVFDLSRRR